MVRNAPKYVISIRGQLPEDIAARVSSAQAKALIAAKRTQENERSREVATDHEAERADQDPTGQ